MAKLITTTEKQWRLLLEIFGGERGVILISPEMSKRMAEQKLISEDHYSDIDYDFGGECDVMVDFIASESSYAYGAAKEQLGEENDIHDSELKTGSG
jgi:hypothetical protein